jgi:hypothetical protein
MGEPDEVAKAAVFLASDDSSIVTGIELFVDGAAVKFDQRKLMEDGDAYDRGENALGLWRVSADRIAQAATGKGKRTEIDHLNGFIARRGEALGVVTPANRLLHAIVKSCWAQKSTVRR